MSYAQKAALIGKRANIRTTLPAGLTIKVHVLDYKPDARTNRPIAQLTVYALASPSSCPASNCSISIERRSEAAKAVLTQAPARLPRSVLLADQSPAQHAGHDRRALR